ncbi:cycle-inhibiting factor [Cupriavidus necator]
MPTLSTEPNRTKRTDLFNRLFKVLDNPAAHCVMWSDDYRTRIVDRNPSAILAQINQTIADFGGIDLYKEITEIDPYAFHPACGLSAQNLLKLMVENDHPVDPTTLEKYEGSKFSTYVKNLNPEKNYIFLVRDARLGHAYLVDSPATDKQPSISRPAYVLQSDLGDGLLPAVSLEKWVKQRGDDNIELGDIETMLSPRFYNLAPSEKQQILAKTLDANNCAENVNLDKLRLDKPVTFSTLEYDPRQFYRNLEFIESVGQQQVVQPQATTPTNLPYHMPDLSPPTGTPVLSQLTSARK